MFDFLNQKKNRTPPVLPEGTTRRRYQIHGQVQGVGFRYRAMYAARELGLTGWVQNEEDGSVTLEVQGDPALFPELFAMLEKAGNSSPFSIEIEFTAAGARDLAEVNQAVLDSAQYLKAQGFVL